MIRTLVTAILFTGCGMAADPDAAAVLSATGADGGLAMQVGAGGPGLVIALAKQGAFLAHALVLDPATVPAQRAAIAAAGMRGLASAERWTGGRLPVAARGVDLLVADLDALGAQAPTADEIARVVAPGGSAYLRRGGKWIVEVRPWPADLDDWRMFQYDATGVGVSRDRLGGLPTSLKYIIGDLSHQMIINRGVTVTTGAFLGAIPKGSTRNTLTGRRAFTGVPMWYHDKTSPLQNVYAPHTWASGDGLVFQYPDLNQPAVALNLRTGALVRTYDQGLVITPTTENLEYYKSKIGQITLTPAGPLLLQSHYKRLVALDIASGAKRWEALTTDPIGAVAATLDGRTVVVKEVADAGMIAARWREQMCTAVTGFRDGKQAWRTPYTLGGTDLIITGDRVHLVNSSTNMFKAEPSGGLLCLDLATGREVFNTNITRDTPTYKPGSINNMVSWQDAIWSWGPGNNLMSFNREGKFTQYLNGGYNQRCPRLSGNADFLVFGFTSFVDRQGAYTHTSLNRGYCSTPAYLAHGQFHVVTNLVCACGNFLRGTVVLQPEEAVAEVPDGKRLEKLAATPPGPDPASELPKGLIAADWTPEFRTFWKVNPLQPVVADDLVIQGDLGSGTVVARRGDKMAWRFAAGGRVHTEPVVLGKQVFIAAADGWVTCLDLASGEPKWRFLAAPSERLLNAYGQLESAWPVYGLVAHGGLIHASAGRHAEVDGGLRIWSLDPSTGAIRYRTCLQVPPLKAQITDTGVPGLQFDDTVVPRVPLNGGLLSTPEGLALHITWMNKQGSSNSTVGYHEFAAGSQRDADRKRPTSMTLLIRPEWDGKVVDPMPEIKKLRVIEHTKVMAEWKIQHDKQKALEEKALEEKAKGEKEKPKAGP